MASSRVDGARGEDAVTLADLPALEVALFSLIVFLPGLANSFVYDDILLIRDNPHAHGLSELGRAFTTTFWNLKDHGKADTAYYRPFVIGSFILNWVMGSGKAWIFNLTNVVLNAAVTWFVVRLVRRTSGSVVLSVAAALLCTLHPSRTQSVTWISGRSDVLAALFLLVSNELALLTAAPGVSRGRRVACFVLTLVAFACGLLSKETAVVTPLVVLAEVCATNDRAARRTLGLVAAAVTALGAAFFTCRTIFFPVWKAAPRLTLEHGFFTLWTYVERVLVPWPQTFFYRLRAYEHGEMVCPPLLVGCGVVAALLYLALLLDSFRKDRAAFVLFAVAVAALGPLLNFVYTGIIAVTFSHYLYLPLLFFVAGLCRRYRGALERWALDRRGRAVFALVLVTYLGMDWVRLRDYRDQESILRREIELEPHNPLVLEALSEGAASEGKLDEAFDYLLRSTAPDCLRFVAPQANVIRLRTYMRLLTLQAGRTADGNVPDLERLFEDLSGFVDAQPGLSGHAAAGLFPGLPRSEAITAPAGQWNERELAAAELALLASRLGYDSVARTSLRIVETGYIESLVNLYNVALTYGRLGDFEGARRFLRRARRELAYRVSAGELESVTGRLVTAESLFREAARATGDHQRFLRARGYMEVGAFLRALRELRPVVSRRPDDPELGPLYAQLLLAAGLDDDARAFLESVLGPERAVDALEGLRRGVPPRVRTLRKPSGRVDWYSPRRAEVKG